ncbi:hypothetical protein [Sphingomonas sp. Ant20]|uniref:hypothetical protein n=1 Tax=Sphingomonas sp. Ant20 TaxID=104605 RepID=UPI00325FC6C2
MITDRRAPRGHQQIGIDPGKGVTQRVEPVGEDSEVDNVDGQVGEHRGEHDAV